MAASGSDRARRDPAGGAARWIRRPRFIGRCGRVADTRPMKDEARARRRCTSCRRWYLPAASAAHNQKTCGAAECRRRRRNQVARRRRTKEIHEYRVDERVRQARCRANRRLQGKERRRTGVSRAGLSAQALEIEHVVLERWDRLARVSRAGLKREIHVALGRAAEIVGQETAAP